MQSGDLCPLCRKDRLRCESSRPREDGDQLQYLYCRNPACDYSDKVVVPGSRVWRRQACGA